MPTSRRRVFIASDFDGTLCRIACHPDQVTITPGMASILQRLAKSRRFVLAVISGRSLADLRPRVPGALTVAGNHGLEMQGPAIQFEHSEAARLRSVLAGLCERLEQRIRPLPGAWVENKGLSATVHYRAARPEDVPAVLVAVLAKTAQNADTFLCTEGKLSLELRPRVKWGKGEALQYLRKQLGPFETCICLGDDRTDEDMFLANPRGLNIRVGISAIPTAAQFHLPDTLAVESFLRPYAHPRSDEFALARLLVG